MALLRNLSLAALGGAALLRWAGGRQPEGAILLGDGPPRPAPDHLRVVSWNIHYGYGPVFDRGTVGTRAQVLAHLDAIAAWLREVDADLVALQEVDTDARRTFGIDQLAWLMRATGLPFAALTHTWDARWVPSPGLDPRRHYGQVRSSQATLSRYPLRDAARHALPQPPNNSRIYNRFYLHRAALEVTVDLPRPIRTFNVHTEAFDRANCTTHAEILAGLVRAGDARRTLVLGDLNSVPPEAALKHAFPDEPQTDMRQDRAIDALRAVPDLVEAAPAPTPPEQERAWFTFPSWEPNRRLDHAWAGRDLPILAARVGRPLPDPSDHLPVVLTVGAR